eukprot:CAMPEP_0179154184 /NCGR_PEP_ID=MMETSP0796-20121207/75020_1 /TAXON_ID=73915 /ORGANISM="Pyrodinium bahamense, Strain pbaha01" /LENGTH=87 /DNA_ID=CAMNT_0020855529 /DNA_START=43 /DNA_END=306 /DNA_ORIENTATION=+
MSAGSHPGLMGSSTAFSQTVCLGDLILGKTSSKASKALFRAGLFMIMSAYSMSVASVRAPAFSAMDVSTKTAFRVPATIDSSGAVAP